MPNTTRAFWKTLTNVDVELIDTATEMRIAKRHLDKIDVVRNPVVVAGNRRRARGRLVDSRRQDDGAASAWPARLLGGRPHGQHPDGRPAPAAAGGDGAGDPDQGSRRHPRDADRLHKIVDPEKAALASADVGNTLYRLVQFAIREAVAARTLDEILAARDTLDARSALS